MSLAVRDAILHQPVSLSLDATIADAERLVIEHSAENVYITDTENRLVGVVPAYELVKHRLVRDDRQRPITLLMTPVALMLVPSTSLEAAAMLLRERLHQRLPVVAEGRLIGELCRSSVLQALNQHDQPLSQQGDAGGQELNIPRPRFLRSRESSQEFIS